MGREYPSELNQENRPWVFSDTNDLKKYCEDHGVTHPEQETETGLPETDNEAVHELDKQALESNELGGKWNIFLNKGEVDEVWECVCEQISAGEIWKAKASTKWSKEFEGHDTYVVIVYTPNYLDKTDVERVREILRDRCGIEETLYYKPDLYTRLGIYRDTANEMGLPGASRYTS